MGATKPKLTLIDSRQSRIEALTAQIRAGAYRPDCRAIADAMLADPRTRHLLGIDSPRASLRLVGRQA